MLSTLLPPEGSKTVWEDRCSLVHLDNSKDVSSSAKLLPSVLLSDDLPAEALPQRAVVYPPDVGGDGGEDGGGRSTSLLERLSSHLRAAASPLTAPLNLMWSRLLSGCQPRPAAPPLEWHPHRPWLAAADPRGRVQVLDLGLGSDLGGAGGAGGAGRLGGPCASGALAAAGRPEVLESASSASSSSSSQVTTGCLKAVLEHEALQHQAHSLAWSPTSPGLLAVGAAGVVGLWALAGEARPPLAAAGRATGPWLRLLRTRVSGARVTGLSWSPDGRLLAAASPNQAGLQVWEVASGAPTSVSAGPAAFDVVRWSPCGNYVFAAGTGSRYFYIFETHRWRWARWEIGSGGTGGGGGNTGAAAATAAGGKGAGRPAGPSLPSVVAAVWAPSVSGRSPILLAALSGQSYLVAVHLVDSSPGLTAQLLPVALPELQRAAAAAAAAGGAGGGGGPSRPSPDTAGGGSIADLAWDARGERLAVLFAPYGHPQAAQFVALYSTITDPLVSARLVGLARPPEHLCALAAAAGAAGAAASAPAAPAPSPAAATEGQQADVAATAGPAAHVAAAGPHLAALRALPGALTVARLAPLAGGAGRAGSGGEGPQCVISARVGEAGVYNLPCYF